ncbi:ras and ef-hand domain-containing protein [Anaeramoeba flamelloides]|uniref:Ras and ef-hand domain-containing protein n=1 Tax=Anaeramoeba flamelloides TaxID=1746091 RepID=A0ABQ8XHL5_9EUKA|nr:ras and ef-hand domain-containing protein [Anaeramoeba flamelloides]
MTSEQNLYRFKVVLLGESAVGKSSLVTRLIKNQFNSSIESTLGATYSNHLIDLGKYQVQLQIWHLFQSFLVVATIENKNENILEFRYKNHEFDGQQRPKCTAVNTTSVMGNGTVTADSEV